MKVILELEAKLIEDLGEACGFTNLSPFLIETYIKAAIQYITELEDRILAP